MPTRSIRRRSVVEFRIRATPPTRGLTENGSIWAEDASVDDLVGKSAPKGCDLPYIIENEINNPIVQAVVIGQG